MTEPALKFYPASHRYKLDGRWVPGVTTIIKNGLPKDQLMYWSARTVAEFVADNRQTVGGMYAMGRAPMVAALKEIPFQRRDDAAVKGTDVHNLAEQLVHGVSVAVPAEIEGYVQAAVDFLDQWKPLPLVVERPLANREHWWAGKPDLFARLPDGRVILWDYKTTASGVWPETAFQLCAYAHAEFFLDEEGLEQPIPEVDLCAAVWLQADGVYQVVPLKTDDGVYEEFLHIKAVADAARRAKGSRTELGYVLPPLDPPSEEVAA